MDASYTQRTDYALMGMTEGQLSPDPIQQFEVWFQDAVRANVPEPNAMTLATSTREGMPSARIVLLRGVDQRGFAFFTNYQSQKGDELEENPRAALVFFWQLLERQVRIVGTVTKTTRQESESYFASRPYLSQLGAWASQQSEVVESREQLEKRMVELKEQFGQSEVSLPPHWGGYRVQPTMVEFWQGRPNRLHDRIRYVLEKSASWKRERLAP